MLGGLRNCLGLVILGASGTVLGGQLTGRHVGIDVRFYATWVIDRGGRDFKPAFARLIIRAAHKSGAAYIGNLRHRLFGRQTVGDFDNRPLGIAIQQQVALGVYHNAAAYLVAPIIVVRDAAQGTFNAAQNNGGVFERLTAALAVNNRRPVRAFTRHIAWRVGVVTADFSVCGVAVDHGVHVAAGHAPEQIGLSQSLESLGTSPVGLGNDANPKALRFEHAADDRHTEAGVVNIGVAGDQHDVAAVPTQLVHLGATHR